MKQLDVDIFYLDLVTFDFAPTDLRPRPQTFENDLNMVHVKFGVARSSGSSKFGLMKDRWMAPKKVVR